MRFVPTAGFVVALGVVVFAGQQVPAPALTPARAPTAATSVGGHPEEGRPMIRAYQPLEIGGGNQTWSILQDRRGVMYFGTSGALLEFDGASWRRMTIGQGTVRAMAMDDTGRIWIGSVGQIGYLAADAQGVKQFVSVVDKLPSGTPAFADVWRTFATADGVVFQTARAIFRWHDDRMSVIPAASRFGRASLLDGRVYVPTPESGLAVLEGDTLKPVPGTQPIGAEPYPVVLRYDERRLLVGTRQDGLFLYDGAALTPFRTDADTALKSGQLYRGIQLSDGVFGFTTTSAGVFMLDHVGHRVMTLDTGNGLPSNSVYYALRDRDGALWLGLDNGVARIETPSPVSYFDRADGITAGMLAGQRFQGRMYYGTQAGVLYLVPQTPDGAVRTHFEHVAGPSGQCWSFAPMNDPDTPGRAVLLATCSSALYAIEGTKAVTIKESKDLTFRANSALVSRLDPSRVWIGLFDGIASFRWAKGRWIDEGRVDGTDAEIRSLFENQDGSIWGGTSGSGLFRLVPASTPGPGTERPAMRIERLGEKDGLPPGGVAVVNVGGVPLFTAGTEEARVFRYDATRRLLVRDTAFDNVVGKNLSGYFGFLVGDPEGRVYLNQGRESAVMTPRADGTWAIDKSAFARFGNTPMLGLVLDGGGAWLALGDGRLARLDMSHRTQTPDAGQALLRRVTGTGERRLYAGDGDVPAGTRLAADANGLRFDYSLPSYVEESATEYQSRLDGFDRDWSAWTKEPQREYTNLGFGDYRFHVRARSLSGLVSKEAVYGFTIQPPPYRTWWAYLGYLGLGLLAIAGLTRITRSRVVAKERQRAQFAEARLRAEAAESLAKTESEGKKNVELLSEMGREITASLDFETIFGRLYERVNQLADADVFGVGLYHPERHEIEYRLAIENGKRYAPYTRDTTDGDQLPVWCIEHREPVFINDLPSEYQRYITKYKENSQALEDGSMSQEPQSLIYLPLMAKDRVLGIITIQSFRKNAYTEHHLNVMRSLASYTAIALDNADAYRQLNEHEHEIRRLFEEAEKARAVAEEADAAKSAFLSTVSHELRTPLTSVLGFAKIIRKRLEDRIFPLVDRQDAKIAQTVKQVEENLKVVVSEGERLTKLIDDVLDLAKIEAGKLEWHMEQVSVADVIDHATAATASLFEQRGLRLIKDVEPGLAAVTGDRDRLIQVVINLISNAVKFTDTGSITCRAVRRANELVVSVIDTGLGIAAADHAKVFERFKQVGDTLTDKPKGTGLGLPICREIVEHHHGRIWVESEPGRGSTFSFTLPVEASALDQAASGAPVELATLIRQLREQFVVSTPRTGDRQPRILVVDDDPNIRELLNQELTEAGYLVACAANGRAALTAVRAERPDLVVLDVMMPEMNGFDVAAVLKNDPETMEIPIVILSIVQDLDRGFRIGVDRYLTKPIDTDLLFREVGTLIEQKKSHKHVLVVDEDASTVRTLADVLAARGYTVAEAREETLFDRAREMRPDIIMLSSVTSATSDAVRLLRFERGMENVLFLVYQ